MIKINLLPSVKIDTRRRKIRNQIIVAVLVLVVALAGMGYWASRLSSELSVINKKNVKAKEDLVALELVQKELDKFEKVNNQLQKKIKTINDLEKKKSGPVHLLDMLSQAIPEVPAKRGEGKSEGEFLHKVYIKNLTAPKFKIQGIAINNDYVVKFTSNLKKLHPLLTGVRLGGSKEVFMNGAKVNEFSITGKVHFEKKVEVKKKKEVTKGDKKPGDDEKKTAGDKKNPKSKIN